MRGRHFSGYTGRHRSAGERLGKGGVNDDPALAEELREQLVRDHPSLRSIDVQVWEIVSTRAYAFGVFDPRRGNPRVGSTF
jgi:hypothetical protein